MTPTEFTASGAEKLRSRLLQSLAETEQARAALSLQIEAADEKRSFRPNPDRWSVLEIVEHLIVAEREVLMGMPDPSQLVAHLPDPKTAFIYPVVLGVLRSQLPVSVPSPTMLPKGGRTWESLKPDWNENSRWLECFLRNLKPGDFSKAFFFHPVAGWMTAAQASRMGQLHFALHARQIRRLLR